MESALALAPPVFSFRVMTPRGGIKGKSLRTRCEINEQGARRKIPLGSQKSRFQDEIRENPKRRELSFLIDIMNIYRLTNYDSDIQSSRADSARRN